MGVPFFFSTIIHKYDNILLTQIPSCDRLFLDFNSIIHTTSAMVVSENASILYAELESKIFEKVVEHTMFVANTVKPSQLLYIAVDGVAPRAKMNQQRRRRYLSSFRNDKINEFKRNSQIEFISWDSNCISPGTEFMKRLDIYLRNYFVQNKFEFQVIFSGHTAEGEGEAKLIDYIVNTHNNVNITDVIYGLDADLIMLSLSCENSHIYLMRESCFFSSSTKKTTFDFKYLDVNRLSTYISRFLYDTDDINTMYDYVFICMLAGNDFLPGLPFLKIRSGAIDIVCDAYKHIRNELGTNLISLSESQIHTIDYDFLLKFLEVLGKQEDDYMKRITTEYYETQYNFGRRFDNRVEKFISEFENNPIIYKYSRDFIDPIDDPQWRSVYYKKLFGSNETDVIKKGCINYIETLIWNINYYFVKKIRKSHYYEYDYSPCVTDLVKYLTILGKDAFVKAHETLRTDQLGDIEINQEMQLLLVLPPQSSHLVDERLRPLFHNMKFSILHYYPVKFRITRYLKKIYHECIPELPNISIEKVNKIYLSISDLYTSSSSSSSSVSP